MITFRPNVKFDKQAAIILLSSEDVKNKKYSFSGIEAKQSIAEAVKAKLFVGDEGEVCPVIVRGKPVVLLGIGAAKNLSLSALRISVRKAVSSAYIKDTTSIEIVLSSPDAAFARAVVEGIVIGTYEWDKYKQKKNRRKTDIALVCSKSKETESAVKIAAGVNAARDLINDNADTVTSEYFEKEIKKLIKGKKDFSIDVLNKKELKAKGLGLHLAVNQGSNKEPKLIIVKYSGAGTKAPYLALVGKGMTYDTGGLNMKPTGSMETMKMDMSGAAAVFGTLHNVVHLKPKRNVLFVFGLAENAVDAHSYKPGDVIKGYAGKTVEVANTDAEGRLVLADAISYVTKNFKPKRLIDIATLTGACVIALGHDYTGLVSNNDKFARALVHSSNDTDDRVWRLPSYPELKDSVSSKIADIRNLGFPKGAGGTITAAEFLRQFVGDTEWAHLDIAGTAYVDNASRMYFGHGGTGAGVRLLTDYILKN